MVNPVQQSGPITPNHLAKFIAPGVIGDAGVPVAPGTGYLAVLPSADMNSILDQPIQLPLGCTAFRIQAILATNASLPLTTAAGGIYPAGSKGGTAIVANTQVYTALTTANGLLSLTFAAGVTTTRYSSANVAVVNGYLTLYLSLTTGQGASGTADFYLIGQDLSY